MKTVIAGVVVLLLAGAFTTAEAQSRSKKNKKNEATAQVQYDPSTAMFRMRQPAVDNGLMMLGGTMVMVKDNKFLPYEEVTLANGAVVQWDGTIVHDNGRTEILQEGEGITMDGEIRRGHTSLNR